MSEKLRIALSGIGNRALPKNPQASNWLGWVELINRSEDFQLVAAQDVSDQARARIIERGFLKPKDAYKDLDVMLERVSCDAILICNPVEHHAQTIRKAIKYGLNILVEKPLVCDLREGKEINNLIHQSGKVVAVVQNWRSKDVGRLLYESIQRGLTGKIGHIFFRYLRNRENPNYPAYIFKEEYPLLYAMGIHHLDLFKYILQDEYQSVSGHSFKPPWSMYESDTGLNLLFRTKNNVALVYSGTVSSQNYSISQESLVIEGEKGTLFNESQWLEPPLWFYAKEKKEKVNLTEGISAVSVAEQYNIADESILKNFYLAVTKKAKLLCSAEDGLKSVVALEASKLACKTGKTIYLQELLNN